MITDQQAANLLRYVEREWRHSEDPAGNPFERELIHDWKDAPEAEECRLARQLFNIDAYLAEEDYMFDYVTEWYEGYACEEENKDDDDRTIDTSRVLPWLQSVIDTDEGWFHYGGGVHDGLTWSLWGCQISELPAFLVMQDKTTGEARLELAHEWVD